MIGLIWFLKIPVQVSRGLLIFVIMAWIIEVIRVIKQFCLVIICYIRIAFYNLKGHFHICYLSTLSLLLDLPNHWFCSLLTFLNRGKTASVSPETAFAYLHTYISHSSPNSYTCGWAVIGKG